ncbi:MAG: hypothetical protein ACLU3N_10375 [Lachnospiraceae bacterium]
MEKNKKIIKLCYLQIAFYVVFLTSLLLHFKPGLDHLCASDYPYAPAASALTYRLLKA